MASSYSECSFYIIDLVKKKETFLCKGFSPYALGLHKFPYFNYQDFPYVLAKEGQLKGRQSKAGNCIWQGYKRQIQVTRCPGRGAFFAS